MSDRKQEAIDDVIRALGTSKAFSEEDKRVFAENIINEAPFSHSIGLQVASQKKYYRELRSLLKKANTAMTNLYKKIEQGLDGTDIDGQASQIIDERLSKDVNHHVFCEYIDTFQQIANSRQLAKRKRGPNNRATRLVARMIASQYYKQFGSYPAFTEHDGLTPKQTPYGRACLAVEKYLSVNILMSNQRNAVDFIKKKK